MYMFVTPEVLYMYVYVTPEGLNQLTELHFVGKEKKGNPEPTHYNHGA